MTLADPLADTLAHLRDSSDLRVWSVIVTLMGDLTVMGTPDSDTSGVTGQALGQIMDALNIRPEATRVALHRLRKDGWIESTRHGRRSVYHLSKMGLAQTKSVTDLIYGPAPAAPERWHMVVLPPLFSNDRYSEMLISEGFCDICPGVFLGHSTPPKSTDVLHLSDTTQLPLWAFKQLTSDELRNDIFKLRIATKDLQDSNTTDLIGPKRAALRVVLLHEWRRIALRLPTLPIETLYSDLQVRDAVHHILETLGPIRTEQWAN